MKRCDSCDWWVRSENEAIGPVSERGHPAHRIGECWRFPPHPKYGRPMTQDDDRCGEHKEKEHA